MNLREYMAKNKLTNAQMAKLCHCSVTLISFMRMGKPVGHKSAYYVEMATKGEVTFEDIMAQKPLKYIEVVDDKQIKHEENHVAQN